MRKLAALLILLPLPGMVACAPGTQRAEFGATEREAVRDSVTAALAEWTAALGTRDSGAIVRLYSDSSAFRWVEDGQVRYASRADMAGALHQFLPGVRALQFSLIEPEVIVLAPGVASVTTGFVQKMTDTTGSVTGLAGTITGIVVHAASGWQFLSGHTSLLPPPSPSSATPKGGSSG